MLAPFEPKCKSSYRGERESLSENHRDLILENSLGAPVAVWFALIEEGLELGGNRLAVEAHDGRRRDQQGTFATDEAGGGEVVDGSLDGVVSEGSDLPPELLERQPSGVHVEKVVQDFPLRRAVGARTRGAMRWGFTECGG